MNGEKIAKKGKLIISPRVAKRMSRASIRGNLIRALVELITNSDDSYRRLEEKGLQTNGSILIKINKKRRLITVTDKAEGMNDETMVKRAVMVYGESSSGFEQGRDVRGYFGLGLKDAILAIGFGRVISIKDGTKYECTLDNNQNFELIEPRGILLEERKKLRIPKNGTCVTIRVEKQITFTRFENMVRALKKYYSLRDIMSNNRRTVLISNTSGEKQHLKYFYPKGELIEEKKFTISGYDNAIFSLKVFRATEELSGKDDRPEQRDGGILIRSARAIHEITLFKFEGNIYASKLYGFVDCPYIDKLMEEGEQVISDKRDGLAWHHPFCRALKRAIESELQKVVELEKKKHKKMKERLESKEIKLRFNRLTVLLNSIAENEIGKVKQGADIEKRAEMTLDELKPDFDFSRARYYAVAGEPKDLILLARVPNVIPFGQEIVLNSNSSHVILLKDRITIKGKHRKSHIHRIRIPVEGNQVGAEGKIEAQVGELSASTFVRIISKPQKEPSIDKSQKSSPPKGGALIGGIEYDPTLPATQRVLYDTDSGIIRIATKSPSVRLYLGPKGEGQEEPHCQVLTAELVISEFCRRLATEGVKNGRFVALGPPEEAINFHTNQLLNKYALIIHKALVSPEVHEQKIQRKRIILFENDSD